MRGMNIIDYIKSGELKTSEEWQKIFSGIKVIEFYGWNMANFQFSWHEEKINIKEYNKRLLISNVKTIRML